MATLANNALTSTSIPTSLSPSDSQTRVDSIKHDPRAEDNTSDHTASDSTGLSNHDGQDPIIVDWDGPDDPENPKK